MKRQIEMKVKKITPKGEIFKCPVCGYNDGFHVSFHMQDDSDKAGIILICPKCHNHFEIGWEAVLSKKQV
ncbi:MAG: hypothetical protein JRG68_04520 [Deltaproteobacteria bacterium]|nr:hypothetical protein [Deltaproteobacteria bacterium]MBW2100019.1 hypothetical protein [Deltaproteobacteria bacterium]